MLDEGRLTDGRGRIVNFKNTIIIMTSNMGSDVIQTFSGKNPEKMETSVMEILMKSFRPEFLNRLDQTVIFHSLSQDLIEQIVDLQLTLVSKRLALQRIDVSFTPALRAYIAEIGYDPVYGVRPLKRAIQDAIVDELSLQIIEKKVLPGVTLKVDYKDKKVIFQMPN